jgi:hypothetical protein
MTPAELYDLLSGIYKDVAILEMGDIWVFGRMRTLSEVDEETRVVRRLGDKYGIEVAIEASSWPELVRGVIRANLGKVRSTP